jgi:hypothetical protein
MINFELTLHKNRIDQRIKISPYTCSSNLPHHQTCQNSCVQT